MDKNNKVLLSIFLSWIVGGGAVFALVFEAFIRIPNFSAMRSKVSVPIKLADETWVNREIGPLSPGWVGYKNISKPMLTSVIAAEDTSFYSHEGIDYHELGESIKKDWELKRWARGASTLTQQVVKNVYLSREKSLWRKFKELIWAREMEKVLTKAEILTFYLNMAEWGPSLYGIGEASRHYFGLPPSEISPKQAAFLAMLLPSPIKHHVYFSKKSLTPYASSRVGRILRIMLSMGFITEDQYRAALVEKLWGVTGELPVEQKTEPEVSEDSDNQVFQDVLQEPSVPEPGLEGSPTVSHPDNSAMPQDVLKEPLSSNPETQAQPALQPSEKNPR
jgi:monofunctional glycosyltransferase